MKIQTDVRKITTLYLGIEVYQTNVLNEKEAASVLTMLQRKFPGYRANFDLDDCDRILRIENPEGGVDSHLVCCLVQGMGYFIRELE